MNIIGKFIMKFLIATGSVLLVLFVCLFIYLYIGFSQGAKGTQQAMKRFTPGTIEFETYKRWHEESEVYYEHAGKAKEYEKKGQYDLAIGEYKKAAECKAEKWSAHRNLLDVYEKAGYHDLAIQEIDWLLSQKPRQQVVDELIERKRKSEEELKNSTKRINIIDSVTEKSYVVKEMGKPDETINSKDGSEIWIYKEYMSVSQYIPNMTKRQPFVIVFDKSNVVVENYTTDLKSLEILRKESN